tara:strand:- start:8183 stop:9379 length:1197 start_codon:yes stop_codon:yes gene_type:complete
MVDILNENGLTVNTAAETRAELETLFRDIYGQDINLDQNSPDGQVVGITTQISTDLRELLVGIYNSFDPDNAVGTVLDSRVQINNIVRQGGSYTITPVDITVDRTVALDGLDSAFNDVDGIGFTVQDDSGNEFILIDTVELTAGTHSLPFRSKTVGLVNVTVGTVQNAVTIVLGVTDIDNSSAPTTIGQNEETDAQLRVRRQQSVSLGSSGYINGLLGAVLNISGVTAGKLYENITSVIDGDGIPAHGMWLIVEGGANTEIADTIFRRKSCGSDMTGDILIDIETESGAIFTARFDRPESTDLYVRFDIQPTITGASFGQAEIKAGIVESLLYGIGESSNTSAITTISTQSINDNGGGGVAVNVEISDDGVTWFDYLESPTLDAQWTLDASRITITEL